MDEGLSEEQVRILTEEARTKLREEYALAMYWLSSQGIAEHVGKKQVPLLSRVVAYGVRVFSEGFRAGEKEGKSSRG